MIALTKHERFVLSVFIFIILSGSILHYAFKKYPALKDSVNLIDSDHIYFKVNINTDSFEELVEIPYIGEYTARNIIEHRRQYGPFLDIEQIKEVKGIRKKNYKRFFRYIKI